MPASRFRASSAASASTPRRSAAIRTSVSRFRWRIAVGSATLRRSLSRSRARADRSAARHWISSGAMRCGVRASAASIGAGRATSPAPSSAAGGRSGLGGIPAAGPSALVTVPDRIATRVIAARNVGVFGGRLVGIGWPVEGWDWGGALAPPGEHRPSSVFPMSRGEEGEHGRWRTFSAIGMPAAIGKVTPGEAACLAAVAASGSRSGTRGCHRAGEAGIGERLRSDEAP